MNDYEAIALGAVLTTYRIIQLTDPDPLLF